MKRFVLCLTILGVLFMGGQVNATLLDVDFNNGFNNLATQSGFVAQASNPQLHVTGLGNIGVDIASPQTLEFRDRGALLLDPLPDLGRDFVFVRFGTPTILNLTLTPDFSGVFDITTYHHDKAGSLFGNPIDIFLTDSVVTNLLVAQVNSSSGETMTGIANFSFVADGVSPVLISYQNKPLLMVNGFSLNHAIPEPSTLLLFTLGFVGILGLGYRQRKKAA